MKAKVLLVEVSKVLPPGLGQRHNLTLSPSEDLALNLMLGAVFLEVILDDEIVSQGIGSMMMLISAALLGINHTYYVSVSATKVAVMVDTDKAAREIERAYK